MSHRGEQEICDALHPGDSCTNGESCTFCLHIPQNFAQLQFAISPECYSCPKRKQNFGGKESVMGKKKLVNC